MINWNIEEVVLSYTMLLIMWPAVTQITVELLSPYSLQILGTFLCLFTFIQGYLLGMPDKDGDSDEG